RRAHLAAAGSAPEHRRFGQSFRVTPVGAGLRSNSQNLCDEVLAHLIHCIAGIRKRAWCNRLESLRDWLSTPLSSPGQNLPCPPPTTIPCFRSLCQTSARRRSPPRLTAARSVPMAECFFWPA